MKDLRTQARAKAWLQKTSKGLALLALLVAGLSPAGSVLASDCDMDPNQIGAVYRLTETRGISLNAEQNVVRERNLSLWRYQNQVAHLHHDENITDIWNRVPNGWLRPVRYFDEQRHGIEYQASEVNGGKGEQDWSLRYQLVSDRQLLTLERGESIGSGCQQEIHYSGTHQGRKLELIWLPALKLVKSYRESKTGWVMAWELKSLETSPARIAAVFESRESYQTTDYADIGDNETDPFLTTLINQGFVSHGASGFYDTGGNAITGFHRH